VKARIYEICLAQAVKTRLFFTAYPQSARRVLLHQFSVWKENLELVRAAIYMAIVQRSCRACAAHGVQTFMSAISAEAAAATEDLPAPDN
jgi:hypothetical protein